MKRRREGKLDDNDVGSQTTYDKTNMSCLFTSSDWEVWQHLNSTAVRKAKYRCRLCGHETALNTQLVNHLSASHDFDIETASHCAKRFFISHHDRPVEKKKHHLPVLKLSAIQLHFLYLYDNTSAKKHPLARKTLSRIIFPCPYCDVDPMYVSVDYLLTHLIKSHNIAPLEALDVAADCYDRE